MPRPSNRTLRYGLSSMMWIPRSDASAISALRRSSDIVTPVGL
jgi:hypothetical protein